MRDDRLRVIFFFCWKNIPRLKRAEMKKVKVEEEKAKSIVRQMMEDKREVQRYIRQNGSLKGFKNGRIKFAKPF